MGDRQLAIGVTSSQNYTIPRGNWKLASQSLAVETVQFLKGTSNLQLGAAGRGSFTKAERLAY